MNFLNGLFGQTPFFVLFRMGIVGYHGEDAFVVYAFTFYERDFYEKDGVRIVAKNLLEAE